MAGTNTAKVYIGTLEPSSTTGALMRGPVITTIPADFTAALAAIAGGDGSDSGKCFPEEHPKCPYCGSKNTVYAYYDMRYYCKDCGREFG